MGDPNAPALETRRILETLGRHQVDYVIVGGMASIVHGAGVATFDIAIVPAFRDANLQRLANALADLRAGLRVEGEPEPVPFPLDPQSLRTFEVSTWRTDAGDLDIIIGIPTATAGELATFEELADRAHERSAFGLTILIADLEDIITSKVALSRGSDLAALPALRDLQQRLDSESDS